MTQLATASAQELSAIRALLDDSGLPTSDLESAEAEFTVVRQGGRVVAAGALQRFGASALLRSVVVAESLRGSGLGRMIVWELERVACATRTSRLFLLTQTASEFFARQGYHIIERSSAPQDIQGTEEFRSLCPGSATCMAKDLPNSQCRP